MKTLSVHSSAGRLCLLARAANCTPSVMCSRILDGTFAAWKPMINDYRDWLRLRRMARLSGRFHAVLWRLWSGVESKPIAGLTRI